MDWMYELLVKFGVREDVAAPLGSGIVAVLILLLSVISFVLARYVILRLVSKVIMRNRYRWDNIMLERKVFHRVTHMVPAIILYTSAPVFGDISGMVERVSSTYMLVVIVFTIAALLNSVDDIYRAFEISKIKPIKGYLQVIKIVVAVIVGILVIATLMGKSPLILLSGIGALAAVFSFVFKDTILGFFAGIQLTSDDMVRIGDWIEMTKYGVDGYVQEIGLLTVKVQNFDRTILTIPTYALVSDSFKNWRGMEASGGRRIKRSFYVDASSICFCDDEMVARFKKIQHLKDYMLQKEKEISAYNKAHAVEDSRIDGRHLTNIGTFRAYIQAYLDKHPSLHPDMPKVVRQLPPGEYGLPLEIYAFARETQWDRYENIQADIIDHILATVDIFGLRIFQNPTGFDMRQIGSLDKK